MIDFKYEEDIKSYLVDLENHVTLLKAHIECEKRKRTVVTKTTDGFIFKANAKQNLKAISDCASVISKMLDE